MKRILLTIALAATLCAGAVAAPVTPDEKDLDESIRKPVRRLRHDPQFGQEMKKKRDEIVAKHAREEEKQAKKEAKKNVKAQARPVVETRQQPASTADKSLMQQLLSKDYSIVEYDWGPAEPQPIVWKDDPVSNNVDTLLTGVKTVDGFYTPRGVTMKRDANEVFFAFKNNGSRATGPLELRVYYFADDPLNYNEIEFTIDGFPYKITPARPSRGKMGARMYWEQSQDALTADDKDLVYALAHCHWARLSLHGADGINHVKLLSNDQLKAFATTFELYRAMGGKF